MSHLLAVLHAQYSHVRRREWCEWSSDRVAKKKCTQRFRDKSSVMKTFRILTGRCHSRSLIDALEFSQQCIHIYVDNNDAHSHLSASDIGHLRRHSHTENHWAFFDRMLTVRLCLCACHLNTDTKLKWKFDEKMCRSSGLYPRWLEKNRRKLHLSELWNPCASWEL